MMLVRSCYYCIISQLMLLPCLYAIVKQNCVSVSLMSCNTKTLNTFIQLRETNRACLVLPLLKTLFLCSISIFFGTVVINCYIVTDTGNIIFKFLPNHRPQHNGSDRCGAFLDSVTTAPNSVVTEAAAFKQCVIKGKTVWQCVIKGKTVWHHVRSNLWSHLSLCPPKCLCTPPESIPLDG